MTTVSNIVRLLN